MEERQRMEEEQQRLIEEQTKRTAELEATQKAKYEAEHARKLEEMSNQKVEEDPVVVPDVLLVQESAEIHANDQEDQWQEVEATITKTRPTSISEEWPPEELDNILKEIEEKSN